ncbi:hypothetical protein ABC974_20525 [Sphingomonas oligophenolica]|uniref:DUF4019 domain-containing protein n=1 Tax=Sphingomonas oligophenolica TaxID=301154 RepID=A0ABU9Y8B4_9SPHN
MVALSAGIVLCALIAAPLDAEYHPSTRAIMKMSREEANRQAQDDLLSILEPTGKISAEMWRELHDVTLNTRSFGTDFDGVCRRDTLTLRYTGAVPGAPSRDKPVRPYSIEARPVFHIVHLPKVEKDMGQPDASHIWQPACVDVDKAWLKRARADGRELGEWDRATWADAKDAFQVVQAGFLLEKALAAVKAGTLKLQSCPHFLPALYHSCEEEVAGVGSASDIGVVESCPAQPGVICYSIDFPGPGTILKIVSRGDAASVVSGDILSIDVDDYLMVDGRKFPGP